MMAVAATARSAEVPPIIVEVFCDGSIQVEGQRIVEQDAQQTRLTEIANRMPNPRLSITFATCASADGFVQAMRVFQRAGLKLGFITNPPP
jgi:biopolymer transport protein ExbD